MNTIITRVWSALGTQFVFFGEKCLKMCCTKVCCYKLQYTTFGAKIFLVDPWVWPLPWWYNSGFWQKCLKNALYKTFFFFLDKSCYKSKAATLMLCNIFLYLAPFWSYSVLRNTLRKFCAVLRNRFFIHPEKNFSKGCYFEVCLWFCFIVIRRKRIFRRILNWAVSVILLSARKEFSEGCCFELRLWYLLSVRKNFP